MSSSRQLSFTAGAGARHSSQPSMASPLHTSFPAYPTSASAPGSPPAEEDTPTKASKAKDRIITRSRGESRSSSVPPLAVSRPRDVDTVKDPKKSVKHLTCFWWKEKGSCRFSDEDCLYAHYDTGRYTEPPRQLNPDEPAKAGRNLERAIRNLPINPHRSSASLHSLGHSRSCSRSDVHGGLETPSQPSRPTSPRHTHSPRSMHGYISQTQADSAFLKGLVHSAAREKDVMSSIIEGLQADKARLLEEVGTLKSENVALAQVRDRLVTRLSQSRVSPFGAIGTVPTPVYQSMSGPASRGLWPDPPQANIGSGLGAGLVRNEEPHETNGSDSSVHVGSFVPNLGPRF